jgi:hypothetical protein
MQAFYPASSLPRPWVWGLVLLVLVVHLLGLQALFTTLNVREAFVPAPVTHLRLSAPPPTAAVELKPLPTVTTAKQTPVANVVAPPSASVGTAARGDMADTTPIAQTIAPQPDESPSTSQPAPDPVASSPEASANNPTPAATPWLSQAKFAWPAPVLLNYELSGTSKGVRYNANASISWQHQGNGYQLRHEIQAFLFGNRSQTSVGHMGAAGLLPSRFGDQFRQEQAAHFDRTKGLLIYSANTPSQTIEEGAQDRVSLFVQMAAAMAGTPNLRAEGQQFGFQVVSAKQADSWLFVVLGAEQLTLPMGTLPTLKLHRVPRNEYDQKIDIWLSVTHGYMPARIRITQANGDVVEESLKSLGKP